MSAAAAHDEARRRTAAIDGLRGLAALSVLVFHVWLYTLPRPDASARDGVLEYAVHELRLGLVLFFVLSGFLLYMPWVAAALGGARRPRLGAYALRRAARVAPAYYLALAGSVLLLWGADGTPGVRLPDGDQVLLFVLFAQNFSTGTVMSLDPPMWTLAVEVSFYVALPLAGALALRGGGGRARQTVVPLALLALGVAYNAQIAGRGLPLTASKILPAMLPYFALGMLAAVLAHGRRVRGSLAAALALLGLAAVVGDAVWHARGAVTGSHALELRIVRDVPAAAGFALIIALVGAGRSVPLLSSRPLAALGTVSYGIYLWHVPVMLGLRANGLLPLAPVLAFPVVMALTLPIAAASWRFVERPAIERARRAAARGSERAPARPPAMGRVSA